MRLFCVAQGSAFFFLLPLYTRLGVCVMFLNRSGFPNGSRAINSNSVFTTLSFYGFSVIHRDADPVLSWLQRLFLHQKKTCSLSIESLSAVMCNYSCFFFSCWCCLCVFICPDLENLVYLIILQFTWLIHLEVAKAFPLLENRFWYIDATRITIRSPCQQFSQFITM